MHRPRVIIFDLDGTLVDAYPAITASFNFAMIQLGYPKMPSLIIRRAVGWGDRNLLKPFVKKADLEKAVRLYRQHHRRALLQGSRLLPGVKQTIAFLKKQGFRLAIASNRPTRFSAIMVRHLGIKKHFSYMLCADVLSRGKPHPGILLEIIRHFEIKRQDALYVGDMTIDAQAGRRAGIRTVIVTTGSHPEKKIRKEKPFLIIRKISELPKHIPVVFRG